jgi:hypothetical protein
MRYHEKLPGLLMILLALCMLSACSAGSPDPVVRKFIMACETGNWTSAEGMLSERGRLAFEQSGKSLQKTYWPVLGMASSLGVEYDVIKEKQSEVFLISSSDSQNNTANILVTIKNGIFAGEQAEAIKSKARLGSLDVVVSIKLIQELNRWKVERISIQGGQEIESKWLSLADSSISAGGK